MKEPLNIPFETGFYLHVEFGEKHKLINKRGKKHVIRTKNWTAEIEIFLQTKLLRFEDQKAVGILFGDLVSGKIDEDFISSFRKKPLNAANTLNGSWAFVFFDLLSCEIKIVTNRINSRPLFMYSSLENKEAMISSTLHRFPKRLWRPDWAGVGWKLSNGVTYSTRTIFKNIRKLDRSSVYDLSPGSVSCQPYWELEFTESLSGKSVSSLKKDYSDLLRLAVKRCIPDEFPALIALTGGHDSTCIFGALAEELRPDELICFSFEIPASRKDSDASAARAMADLAGFPHQTISSYDGNILKTLALNASQGEGISNFCDESQGWERVRQMYPEYQSLFAGFCYTGWAHNKCRRIEDVLDLCAIRNSKGLSRFSGFFLDRTARKMASGVENDLKNIIGKIPGKRLEDKRDYIYLDQRYNSFILPWKSFFWERDFLVKAPLLDNDIIDFVSRLPVELRNNKHLFRETCKSMFPGLYSIPRARTSNYSPDWRKELHLKEETVLQRLRAQKQNPLSDAWEYESFLRLIQYLFKGLPGQDHWGAVYKNARKIMWKFPEIRVLLRRFFPLVLDEVTVLLGLLSLFGFVFDIDYMEENANA